MGIPGTGVLIAFTTMLVIVCAAVVLSIAAVWFGLHVVAPKIRRALDRAETEEEQPIDRPG